MLPEAVASPRCRRRVAFQFGLDLRRRRTRRAILLAGFLQSLQELCHLIFVRIPQLYILTDIFKVEKCRVVFAQRLSGRASFLMAPQHAAGVSCIQWNSGMLIFLAVCKAASYSPLRY